MSAWDPWWVRGDYAETYHGSPEVEDFDGEPMTAEDWLNFWEVFYGDLEATPPVQSRRPMPPRERKRPKG